MKMVDFFKSERERSLKEGKKYGKWSAKKPKVKKAINKYVRSLEKMQKTTPSILLPEKLRLKVKINALKKGIKIGIKTGQKNKR